MAQDLQLEMEFKRIMCYCCCSLLYALLLQPVWQRLAALQWAFV
jgi:hypothetical protein